MSKRLIAAIAVIMMFVVAIFIPEQKNAASGRVSHQHRTKPGVSEEAIGFSDGVMKSNLPLIIIDTKGKEVPGKKREDKRELKCEYRIIDNADGVNCSEDKDATIGRVALSVRGNSSRHYNKMQYSLKLKNKKGLSESKSLLGMPYDSTWVLNGSEIDHSQLRNYMLYNISGEIMNYSPRSRLCEVLFTDSSGNLTYQGMYTLIEKPKVSPSRLNLKSYDEKHEESSFLLNMNNPVEGIEIPHLKSDSMSVYPCELVYPSERIVTEQTLGYIKRELAEAEKTLYDAAYTGDWKKTGAYFDIDSFVDYYIINEFFQNYDAGVRSTYLYADMGGKISIGPVWDFDGAINNFLGADYPQTMIKMNHTFYYIFMTQNPEFIRRLEKRYAELRHTHLSDENLINYIDESYEYAKDAIMRNCDRWYDSDEALVKEDIEKMKKFVKDRGKWMDEHFVSESMALN